MKSLWLGILFLLSGLSLDAQYYYNNLYDYDNGDTAINHATTSIALDSGNFLIAGHKFLPNYSALHYFKINSAGDTVFNKKYAKANCAYYTAIGNSFIKCYDGNLAHCGAYADSLGNVDAILVKLTTNGDTLWTRKFGGANFDNSNILCETPDSGFVLMGVTQSYSTGSASDFYLVKTDKNGMQQWQQVYGTTATEDCVSGQITLDGGYIMSGHKSNVLHIVKTDAMGGFQWQQTYSGTKNVGFIKQLADSSYILTGAKNVAGSGDQACMSKLNKNGGLVWQKTFGEPGMGIDLFYTRALILSDHSIVVGGISTIGSIPIGLLVKTDSAGNQQWLRTYYANPSFDNYVYDLKQTPDNGFLLVGSGRIISQDAWVVKVDSVGCEIVNCNVGIDEFQSKDLKLLAFPNPAVNELNLTLEGQGLEDFQIRIVNVLGEVQSVCRTSIAIDISELSSGVYFVSATSNDGIQHFTTKFIKK